MLGRVKRTGELVAVKKIPMDFVLRKAEYKRISKEIPILKALNHRNVIRYHDVVLTESNLYIVLEYAEGKELFDLILENRTLSEREAARIVHHVASALQHLHERGVVHADLKPENVILKPEDDPSLVSVKIIDFGLAHFVSPKDMTTQKSPSPSGKTPTPAGQQQHRPSTPFPAGDEGGTLGYRAPELFASSERKRVMLTQAADMWALGVITYILLAGYPPFCSEREILEDPDSLSCRPFWLLFNDDTPFLRESIRAGRYSFASPFWDDISSDAKDFVSRLLTVDPRRRMTAAEAVSHQWICETYMPTPRKPPPPIESRLAAVASVPGFFLGDECSLPKRRATSDTCAKVASDALKTCCPSSVPEIPLEVDLSVDEEPSLRPSCSDSQLKVHVPRLPLPSSVTPPQRSQLTTSEVLSPTTPH